MYKKRGISLIETLISLSVVGVALVALLPVMTMRKDATDLNKGNRYWEKSGTIAIGASSATVPYYKPASGISVAIGKATTPEDGRSFRLYNEGFENYHLAPVKIKERLYWDGQIIEEIHAVNNSVGTLYFHNETNSNQAIIIDNNKVIIDNDTSAAAYKYKTNIASGAQNKTLTINRTGVDTNDNIYLLSNQGQDYLYVNATKQEIAIGQPITQQLSYTDASSNTQPIPRISIIPPGTTFDSSSYTGVGNNSPSLLVIGRAGASTAAQNITSYTDWVILKKPDDEKFYINANISASKIQMKKMYVSSDRRLKNIIANYKRGLNEVRKITPVEFTYKNDAEQEHHIGVIAQDIMKFLPEAVVKNKKTGYFMVVNDPIFYAFINAVKELHEKNLELKKNNDELEAKIKKLKEIKANLQTSTGGHYAK